MINFWISFLFLFINWIFASLLQGITYQLILISTLYFTLYFSLPIIKKEIVTLLYYVFPLLILYTFRMSLDNIFVWFLFLSLLIDNTRRLTNDETVFYCLYVTAILLIPLLIYHSLYLALAFSLISFIVTYTLYELKKLQEKKAFYENRFYDLTDENRQIKRQLISGENIVRQEERGEIARELHDSVGHRLTALLMQLEVARVQTTDEESKVKYQELKELAQMSLKETRNAVYALKSDETSGIQAIIQLIRKLELESHLEISFIVQSGVLSMKLTNDQSTVVYRAIQESLTNMMRHSQTRKATIEFALLGSRVVQFKISHVISEKVVIKEGFGLTNMRSRLEHLNGSLTVSQDKKQLVVIGKFPLNIAFKESDERNEEES